MSRRCWPLLLCWAFTLGFLFPTTASAAGPLEILGVLRPGRLVEHPGTPGGYSVGPPGPYRYPEYSTGHSPWYGYGFGVPTYQWGYFGARYRPACVSHKGYYGDYTQWGYRRGY